MAVATETARACAENELYHVILAHGWDDELDEATGGHCLASSVPCAEALRVLADAAAWARVQGVRGVACLTDLAGRRILVGG